MDSRKRILGGRGEEGFTLVELLVAIALFGVVMTAVAGAFISSVRSIGDQRLRTAATRVATSHLETLRSLPFEQLDAEAGSRTTTTPDGRAFTIDTTVANIDASTGAPASDGRVKQITATVRWTSGGTGREALYTTAIAAEAAEAVAVQEIGTVTMFPSPATTNAGGQLLDDIQVTVPLRGFDPTTLVNVSWMNQNSDGTFITPRKNETLTSTTGVNWRGTIAKEKLLTRLGTDGRGEVQFTVEAGSLTPSIYTLAVQLAASSPPSITTATVDPTPVTVASPATGRSCADRNQCQNTTAVTFTVDIAGLDPTQDSVIAQYQLYDRSFVEVPLSPVSNTSGQWRLVVGQRTTKFLNGPARAFRFTAVRSADSATTTATVSRNVEVR